MKGSPRSYWRSGFYQRAFDGASEGDLSAWRPAISCRANGLRRTKAYIKKVDVDYFTQAIKYTQVKKLDPEEQAEAPGPCIKGYGDVQIPLKSVV